MTIEVTLQDVRESADEEVPPSSDFSRWANLADDEKNTISQLTIRLVEPPESQQLNRQYRGKDQPTNVLSFAGHDDELLSEIGADQLLGDLVICAQLVQTEAREKQCQAKDHWAHLTLHGVLHLLGYDHETRQQAEAMEALEISLLETINIKNPYEVVTPS